MSPTERFICEDDDGNEYIVFCYDRTAKLPVLSGVSRGRKKLHYQLADDRKVEPVGDDEDEFIIVQDGLKIYRL